MQISLNEAALGQQECFGPWRNSEGVPGFLFRMFTTAVALFAPEHAGFREHLYGVFLEMEPGDVELSYRHMVESPTSRAASLASMSGEFYELCTGLYRKAKLMAFGLRDIPATEALSMLNGFTARFFHHVLQPSGQKRKRAYDTVIGMLEDDALVRELRRSDRSADELAKRIAEFVRGELFLLDMMEKISVKTVKGRTTTW